MKVIKGESDRKVLYKLLLARAKKVRDRCLIPLIRFIEDVTKLKTTSEITPPLSVMKSILRTSESSMAKFSLLVC